MADTASIVVSHDLYLPAIIEAAGGDLATALYVDGELFVPGVSQNTLDKALKNYDPNKAEPKAVPDPIEKLRAFLAANPDVVEHIGASAQTAV